MKTLRLVLMVIVACVVAWGSRAVAEEKSWKGENVLFTKWPKDITFGDRVGGEQVYFRFSGITPIKVRGEREGWLRIHDGHREGWADKADFVLAREAPAYFHRRIQANPKDRFALFMRGCGWQEKGKPDNAIKDFDECIRLDPTDSSAFNGRGSAWSNKKEYGKAIGDYDEAIRLDPKYAAAFYNRGNAWSEKKEYGKAIGDYDEAIRLDPKHAAAFYNRGNAWSEKKEYGKAIGDYDEVIRLDPKHAGAFNNRGNAWRAKKEYGKAIGDYDEAIRLDPKDAAAFYNRGNAWGAKKEYGKAIGDYDEAIRLDPKHAAAFYNRGNAWSDKKEYGKAIGDYDEVIRLDPKNALPHFKRSVARMLVRRPQAAGGFQDVIDIQGWKGNRASYAVILGHFAARQAADEARARRFLKASAGKLDEAWPYPAVQYLRGEIDEPALLKLADDDDKRTEARCFLGIDRSLKGDRDEALAHLRWVKEHGNASFTEYTIALAELERLERPPAKTKRE